MLQPPFMPANGNVLAVAGRRLFGILLIFGFACLPGCPGGGAVSDVVTGKVTLGDKPVSGMVTFIGPDSKRVSGAATDGAYFINNPPKGLCKITVEGMPGAPTSIGMTGNNAKDASNPLKDVKDGSLAKTSAPVSGGGVAPPKKYASPDNGLSFEVKGGKQEHDIKLTP
jgi:hypothetical protein